MLFFRTTKILKSKKKNASTKLNSRSRKIKKSKSFFVFFSERTRVGALKFIFFLVPAPAVPAEKLRLTGASLFVFPQIKTHGYSYCAFHVPPQKNLFAAGAFIAQRALFAKRF